MAIDIGKNDLFEGIELTTPSSEGVDTSVKDVVEVDGPSTTDPEWNDFVMDLFTEDELFDGRPVYSGLRRVAESILGNILSSRPTQVFPPQGGNECGRATVVWEIVFANGQVFSDVADCWEGNTDDTFVPFNVATAATRAEVRALRKALRIKTVAAEEMTKKNTAAVAKEYGGKRVGSTDGGYDSSGRMTDPQANFIDVKAKQLNIDVALFFKTVFDLSVSRKINKQQASDAIEKLNEYQSDKSLIPNSILSYQSDWRSTN
jgi:hypothetical protein